VKNLIILFFILSCSDKKKEDVIIPKYPNPEHASMKGRVKSLVAWDSQLSFYDSLVYDKEGRLIRRKDSGIWGTLSISLYDSNNFLTREYQHSDIIHNLLNLYHQNGDTLFQSGFRSELRDFIYNDTTFNFKKPQQRNYYLIRNGLFSELVKSSGWKTLFYYDSIDRLIQTETIHNKTRYAGLRRSTFYYYEGLSPNLKSEIMIQDSDTIQIKRYKEGIYYSLERGFAHGDSETDLIYYHSSNRDN
jgi:hypothetical protein